MEFFVYMGLAWFLLTVLNGSLRTWMATHQPEKLEKIEAMEERKRQRKRRAQAGALKTGVHIAKWFLK